MLQPIQCSIIGFTGSPVTLFSALDTESGLLTIAAKSALKKARREGCFVITNAAGIERDMTFEDAHIRAAIEAWQAVRTDTLASGGPRLLYSEAVKGYADPYSMIEPDGVDERGRKYRLAESINNEAVATLATCLWAYQADSRADVLDTADDVVSQLMRGQVVTIGTGEVWDVTPVFKHGYQVEQRAAAAYWDSRDAEWPMWF